MIAGAEACRPGVITIPTNGLLTRRIVEQTDRICAAAPRTQIGLNLSLDGVGPQHDEIRERARQLGHGPWRRGAA